jgi:hypothetical protein
MAQSLVLFKSTLDKVVLSEPTLSFGLPEGIIPAFPIVLKPELSPQNYNALTQNALLQQAANEICKSVVIDTVMKIKPKLNEFLLARNTEAWKKQEFSSLEEAEKFYIFARNMVELFLNQAIEKNANNVAAQKIAEKLVAHAKNVAAYKDYRKEVAINVAKTGASVVVGAVGLASAVGTGGATLGLAIVAMIRAGADVAKLIINCSMEAEALQKRLQVRIDNLRSTYMASKATGIATEVAATVVGAVTKLPFTIVDNVNSLKEDNKLLKGKLDHLLFLADDMTQTLQKFLDQSDESIAALQKKTRSAEGGKKYEKLLKEAEREIADMLENGVRYASMGAWKRLKIGDVYDRAKRGYEKQNELSIKIKDLEEGRSNVLSIFDVGFRAITDIALAGGGYFETGVGAVASGLQAIDKASVALSVVNDTVVTFGLGIKEFVGECRSNYKAEVGKEIDGIAAAKLKALAAGPELSTTPVTGRARANAVSIPKATGRARANAVSSPKGTI